MIASRRRKDALTSTRNAMNCMNVSNVHKVTGKAKDKTATHIIKRIANKLSSEPRPG
jgi:hypothetical protein